MAAISTSDVVQNETSSPTMAKPLYYQQLERALRLDIFLNQAEKIFATNLTDDEGTSDAEDTIKFQNDESSVNDTKLIKGIMTTKQERKSDLARLYNFSKVKKGRKWLKNLLLSDSSEDELEDSEEITELDLQVMLKLHLIKNQHQREFKSNKELKQYQYYSVGLLSNHDRFPDHQKSIIGNKKKTKEKKLERKMKAKLKKIKKKEKRYLENQDSIKKEPTHLESVKSEDNFADGPPPKSSRRKAPMSEAALTAKRRRLWVALAKKEIAKAQKQKVSVHKEVLTNCKKLAQSCQREVRKSALQFQKSLKEGPSRARRLTREMILYWKRYEKVEKELRKRAEKEAQEQLKIDVELREAKRQQRKLNFLITQTELYAHFMSRKLGGAGHDPAAVQEKILNQLNEAPPAHHRGFVDDDYDSEDAKSCALRNAKEAFDTHQSKLRVFGHDSLSKKKSGDDFKITNPSLSTEQDRPQPNIFKGLLKSYQLKGMNWLANLYDQGINGILADEMGLGKTVESIAFLAHIAESQNIWGPFLVIAPASTLHNWQQEFSRFVPKFKVLPYWGNTIDRKVLRKFWTQRDLHTEDASFHVLITSYQLVVQDVKYFQRIKWQYMVLDEAQAIKSSSSVRWKILLGFNCRNRLLLTGTPIQNSMAELWALLHFIMPTLFDSHEEFNEWFSKDIENHAENKATMDEKHLSRLHMILKPFMLRRVKKDVENELSDKIEILMYCHLTTRQKMLYEGLKQKISIEDLLHSASGSSTASQAQSATSSLMNLVMQFRKVCNHSELFERREVKSPFILKPDTQNLSKLVYRDGILSNILPSKDHLLFGLFNIHHPFNIHNSIFKEDAGCSSTFAFTRFCGLSPNELFKVMLKGLLFRWTLNCNLLEKVQRLYNANSWQERSTRSMETLLLVEQFSSTSWFSINNSLTLKELIFTAYSSDVYTHGDHLIHGMPETSQHRKIREKRLTIRHQPNKSSTELVTSPTSTQAGPLRPSKPAHGIKTPQSPSFHTEDQQLPEFPHRELPSQKLAYQRTSMPLFLSAVCPKVCCLSLEFHCSDRSYAYWKTSCLTGQGKEGMDVWQYGSEKLSENFKIRKALFQSCVTGGVTADEPRLGWSNIIIPDKETLVTDSGKLHVLDGLLARLKEQGHRVLIYSQMTRMIDLLEEYMWHRKHTYMRLDGSSKISDRRDMVADFQSRSDIFVFLLSTRAGGLGINLTAADTVVFYDSDWNPTVDQQAMDRAHRLGQTKQVTVYRLICKGTIEERILQRAREKSEIQRMVISGGNFKPDTLKPTEVVSLLLDDDELERKFRQRQAERKLQDDQTKDRVEKRRKREKPNGDNPKQRGRGGKKPRLEENVTIPANQDTESVISLDSVPPSPSPSEKSLSSAPIPQDETSNEDSLVVDDGSPIIAPSPALTSTSSTTLSGSNSKGSKKGGGRAGNNSGKSSSSTPSGRGRGRPKGTCGSKRSSGGRGGRGSGTAAAEMAGAQAGATAAYAAYGYSVSAVGSPNVAGTSMGRSHVMVRGGGIRMRGPMAITPPRFPYKFPNANETGLINTPASSLGPVHPSPQNPSTT